MATCSKCGRKVSAFKKGLVSGLCPECVEDRGEDVVREWEEDVLRDLGAETCPFCGGVIEVGQLNAFDGLRWLKGMPRILAKEFKFSGEQLPEDINGARCTRCRKIILPY
jgi:NMD protein affecting ribosome stability and mRNA decay